MFGHTWTSQYGPKPHGIGGDTWATALGGVTPAQLADGLRATLALGGEFPPSAPKFRAMCFSIPSLAVVRNEILGRDTERTPFGRLVWQHLDTYRARHADADKADRMVRDAYEIAREHVMRGGALPEDPSALIERDAPMPVKPAAPEVVADVAEKLRAVLGDAT